MENTFEHIQINGTVIWVDGIKTEIDLSTKCRGCLAGDDEMHYLFGVFDQDLTLADIFRQTTLFECNEDDGFPPYLCAKCTNSIVNFFNFRLLYLKTESFIRKLLKSSVYLKKEKVEHDEGNSSDRNDNEEEFEATSPEEDINNKHFKVRTVSPSEILNQPRAKWCKFCTTLLPAADFKEHINIHKTVTCAICGNKFFKRWSLEYHMKTAHSNERNHKCSQCSKAFKTQIGLKRHQIVHFNPRSYCCNQCGDRFNTNATLKTHIRLKHIGNKDFVCQICGLAFSLKSTLDKHLARHDKNRPAIFFCPVCAMAYKEKGHMQRHYRRKHTNNYNKPICQYCGRCFYSISILKVHINRFHKENVADGCLEVEENSREQTMKEC